MGSNAGDLMAELRQFGDTLDRLGAVDLTALSDTALIECMRALRPLVCRVQAQEHRLIGAIHRRGAIAGEGAVSTAAWLRNRLRMPESAVVVRRAAALAQLPLVSTAFAAGEICDAHVTAIANVARDLSPEALAGGAEALLVEHARDLSPTRFAPTVLRIRDQLDPDAADRRRRDRLESRWLTAARTFDGCVSVSGLLDPDAGELFLTALGALTPPARPEDTRTAATRRADALLDLCRHAANHAPVAGGEKPHILVTIDLATLRSELTARTGPAAHGAMRRPGNAPEGDRAFGDRAFGDTVSSSGEVPSRSRMPCAGGSGDGAVGVLGSGWPIAAETARRLACDSSVIPMILGSASEPLDVGRLNRTTPPALRRALVYRDGGCRFPFCDRPPEWTDAHHIVHWSQGGATALWNQVLLCRPHHVQVHELGWILTLDPTSGRVDVLPPSRRTHADRGGASARRGATTNSAGATTGSSTGVRSGTTTGGASDDGCLTSFPRGATPLRGAPPGSVQRSAQSCD